MRLSNEYESSTRDNNSNVAWTKKKRLKLSFDAQHLRIPKYTHPTEMTTEMRIYNVINFLLSEQEESQLDELQIFWFTPLYKSKVAMKNMINMNK